MSRTTSFHLSAVDHQPCRARRKLSLRTDTRHPIPDTRYPAHPAFPTHPLPDPRLPAFSLVELMIAIMILGLGMVMVATVFPVSLEITRGTVQLNISQSVADAAAGTLTLRLPRYFDLTSENGIDKVLTFPTNAAPRIILPNMIGQAQGTIAPGDYWTLYQHFDTPAYLAGIAPDLWADSRATPMASTWSGLSSTYYQNVPVSFYTERSFWDADYARATPDTPSFAVSMQNLVRDPSTGQLVVWNEVPPALLGVVPSPTRISITDRVYPPVDLYNHSVYPPASMTPAQALAQCEDRRYAWTAIHYRDLRMDQTNKTYVCSVFVLYRANLDSLYARQDTVNYSPLTPGADTAVPDTFFPQPWLVNLGPIDQFGNVLCTSQVAPLLPAGSFFVRAVGNLSTRATQVAKVVKNNWDGILVSDPADQNTWTSVQINPGEVDPVNAPVAVWVIPPAYHRVTGLFEKTSPVIDVVKKTVVSW